MTDQSLQRHYAELSGEERFRLILAAEGRGDVVEQERLTKSARMIHYRTPDHSPVNFAFNNLALLTYIELMDNARLFHDLMTMHEHEEELAFGRKGKTESHEDAEEKEFVQLDMEGLNPGKRTLGITLAAGCIFREKARGWVLFCERLGVPPYLLWEVLPGYERLKRDMDLAETLSFSRDGLLRWCNQKRKLGEPEIKQVISAETCANESEGMYREQVEWWGG
jgi:hypothetical protein